METASDIVAQDLDYICQAAGDELHAIAGKRLLITGGAGFLGHYLVQAVTHFNRTVSSIVLIQLAVGYQVSRGIPAWLTKLEAEGARHMARHYMVKPLPANLSHLAYFIHRSSLASPTYDRRD